MSRVVVTGLGAVTPLGVGVRRSWRRLLDGHSGIVSLSDPELKHTIPSHDPNSFADIPCKVAALVPRGPKSKGGWTASEWITRDEERKMATYAQFAVAAATEALDDAGFIPQTAEEKDYTAVIIGSGIGSLEDIFDTSVAYAKDGYKKVHPLFVPRLLINLAAGHVSMKYGLRGPNFSPTTACTTGAHAIADAARLIFTGGAHVVLAGAAESCIHPLALAGFSRVRSLATQYNDDPGAASRPFDRDRDGFVIGEGAGVLVLESEEHALLRGAHIHAELRGHGCTGDAYHMTAPPKDGNGARRAMTRAIRNAGIRPKQVDYVNAHATGTRLGDMAENRAIREVFYADYHGSASPKTNHRASNYHSKPERLTVSSNKGAIGHLLGAAGAVEAIFTILSLNTGLIPPTLNFDNFDTSEGDRWNLTFPRPGATEDDGGGGPLQLQNVRYALTNSFGFGGTNASLCFGHYKGIDHEAMVSDELPLELPELEKCAPPERQR